MSHEDGDQDEDEDVAVPFNSTPRDESQTETICHLPYSFTHDLNSRVGADCCRNASIPGMTLV